MKPEYLDPAPPVELRVADLLARMTPKEKIGQLNQILSRQEIGPPVLDLIRDGGVGSRILASGWNAGAASARMWSMASAYNCSAWHISLSGLRLKIKR